MSLSPMLFDSVALNVLALFFPSSALIIKRRDEVKTFVNTISETYNAEEIISLLVKKEYLYTEGGEFLRLSRRGNDLYCLLSLLSCISTSASR